MSFFKSIYLCFISALLLLTQSGCEQNQKPLRLGATVFAGYVPLFLADRNKDFNKQVTMVRLPNNTETMRAFRNGVIDVAALTLDEAIMTRHYIADTTVLLILDHSNGADMLLARPEIKSVEELKGKRIGVEKSASGSFFFKLILEKTGLKEEELDVVPILSDGHCDAFSDIQLDAIVSFEPFASKIKANGANVIFDSSMTPFKILDVLVIHKSLLKTHERQLKAIVDSWYKIQKLIKLKDPDTLEYSAKYSSLSEKEYLEVLSGLSFVSKDENREMLLEKQSQFKQTEAELYENLLKLGFINEKDVRLYNEQKNEFDNIKILQKIYQ